jgi:hypothetical protein
MISPILRCAAHTALPVVPRLAALAMVPLLLSPSGAPAFAQQQWPQSNPYPSGPDDPYNRQAAPVRQQSYNDSDDPFSDGITGDAEAQQAAQFFTPQQLEQLAAPIALYPDTLIAQILAAATYPAQVAAADRWLQAQGNAPAEQVAAAADAQSTWDPSVKALTAFPQVLAMMDRDLRWTTDLGNAYYNQPQDVLQTVQVLRQRAEAAGNLQSTPQQSVEENQGYIQVAPADPQTVYVPQYDPWQAYGRPVSPYPGFSLLDTLGTVASYVGSAAVNFGPGMAMGAFSNTSFGWMGWALNWLTQSVLFHQSDYFSRSTSVAHWNSQGGHSRFGSEQGRFNRYGDGFNRSQEGMRRLSNGYNNSSAYGRSPARFAGNYGYNHLPDSRGYGYAGNYGRPGLHDAPYRPQPNVSARPQGYAHSYGYGSGFNGTDRYGYGRTGSTYFNSQSNWRESERTQPRGNFGQFANSGNRSFSRSADRAYAGSFSGGGHGGGFHHFGGGNGGGHNSYRAPKAPKSFGGGGRHSGGGGFFGGHHGGGGGHGGGGHHHH